MENRPNVIFVLTDDQGPWAAGCCGNDEIRTPYLDQMASEGTRFPNFFCTSPVCSPARASLMTGRIPSAHGVHDWIRDGNMPPDPARYLDGLTCYTDVLADNNYTVGLSGKWHLGDSVNTTTRFQPLVYAAYRRKQVQRCRHDSRWTSRNATRLPHRRNHR